MNRIRRDLRLYLLSRTPLMALLEHDGNQHVYLSRVPASDPAYQNFPCLVYRRMNGGHGTDMDGSDGTAAPIFEFHAIDRDPDKVEEIGETLRECLQGFSGMMGQTRVEEIELVDESDDYLESKVGDDAGFYRTIYQYKVGHQITIPRFTS